MKIKVAIIDSDKKYISRIISAFASNFNDKIDIYSFSDTEVVKEHLKNQMLDVILISEEFEGCTNEFETYPFAFLTASSSVELIDGRKAICKFQKVDQLYKEILGIYSENSNRNIVFKTQNNNGGRIITFLSSSGGSGSSTMAAAAALNMARKGKKVLYLNIKVFASVKPFFQGQGNLNFSDVLFTIKSKKANLSLRLDSAVKQDASGVFFFDDCSSPLDMAEMTKENFTTLIEALLASANYDCLCIAAEGLLDEKTLWLLEKSSDIVLVSTGSQISNVKTYNMIKVLKTLEKRIGKPIMSRLGIMYNIFSSKTGKYIEDDDISIIGGYATILGATPKQIVEKIADEELFDKLA